MTFSIIDFIVGVLLFDGIVHLTFSVTKVNMPSLFGSTPKANMLLGLLLVFVAIDIHAYKYGLAATINNSFLVALLFLSVIFALSGRLVQKAIRNKREVHIEETVV